MENPTGIVITEIFKSGVVQIIVDETRDLSKLLTIKLI